MNKEIDENTKIIKEFYNNNSEGEWNRLDGFSFEFLITTYMMLKHIKKGDKILDIGGGPGRYSLFFAKLGCDVTLIDLAEENVKLALKKAKEMNLNIKAYCLDARKIDELSLEKYDHIFVMGPMYHLFDEKDRENVIKLAIERLEDNGLIYVSFIQLFAGMNYYLSEGPQLILEDPEIHPYFEQVMENVSWCGNAFTRAFFINPDDIIPFMNKFNLEKVSLFGQEGITSSNEVAIMSCSDEVKNAWLTLSKELCEKEKYLTHSSHAMYIGRKK